ncbi:MAG: response regulator, partial [Planctomycetota bacterium]
AGILARVLRGTPPALITRHTLREENSTSRQHASNEDAKPLAGLHILMAEDNRTNQKVAKLLLTRLGATDIRIADDGSAAVEAVARSRPDLVLMDVQMPGMDGFEATEAIRNAEARDGLSRLPIIALTANAMAGDRERCLAAGMDDYVSKPLRAPDLQAAVNNCLLPKDSHPPANSENSSTSSNKDLPMINPDTLAELRELAGEDCPSLYVDMQNEMSQRLSSIRTAHASGDCTGLREATHSLKGACASLGLDPLAEAAGEVEEAARMGTCAGLDQLTTLADATVQAIHEQFPQQ